MNYKPPIKSLILEFDRKEKEDFSIYKDPAKLLRNRTRFFEKLIRDILKKEMGNSEGIDKFFVASVGGFGRKELYPKSDIDILIVHKKCKEEVLNKIYEKLIVPLIDAKIEVGYAFRYFKSMPDNLSFELTFITSLLDMRFLFGDVESYFTFQQDIFMPYIKRHRSVYARLKMEEYKNRLEKYNASPYILEPNIKEGIGGLRDFHYIWWLSRVLFSITEIEGLVYIGYLDENDLKKLKAAYTFLSRVRCYIHYYHYLQKEKLSFDIQNSVSTFFGYKDSSKSLRVEHFMSDYYRHTHNVYLVTSKILHNFGNLFKKSDNYIRKEIDRGIYLEGFGDGEINAMPKVIKRNNRLILKCFYYAKRLRKKLSFKTINLIEKIAQKGSIWQWDDELKTLFFQLISPDDISTIDVLKDMYNSNVFQLIFPEFKNIHHKMQFDAYHIYTIDMHTIIAMSKLTELYLRDVDGIKKKIKNPHILAFAVFLHDIGKGEGKDHAKKGALIAEQIARRMKLDFNERELLIFLVKNHLLLSDIAQKRDISDYRFLKKIFNDVIKTTSNLYYLYFLTIVDLMAVGEGVWNSWRKNLLATLLSNFENIVISEEDFPYKEVEVRKKELSKILKEQKKGELMPLLDVLSENYLMNTDNKDIVEHLKIEYKLISSLSPFELKILPHDKERYFEVIIATKDEKGLFSQLAGALTLAGFNILGANINTRTNGNVLDIFLVDLGKREYEKDEQMFEKLKEYLQNVIVKKEKIDLLVMEKAKKYHKKIIFKEKNDVYFDNVSSEKYTIIEVYAHDHMGLLFEITKTLYNLDLDIYFSRISTFGERAVDVFYVLKRNNKIIDEKELENIKNILLKNINI